MRGMHADYRMFTASHSATPPFGGVPIYFCSLPRAYAAGLSSAAHMRGLKIWLAHGERVYNNIIITLGRG